MSWYWAYGHWLGADWLHWVYMLGGAGIVGVVLAGVRCSLDYFGIWPMDYTDQFRRHR